MWKHLLIMIVILAALIAWDVRLSTQTEQSRAASVRIERLLDVNAVFTPENPIAGFRVERGNGAIHAYVHQQGVWRCLSAYGAIASNDKIGSLLPKLETAQGVIQTRDPQAAREFGFDVDDMLTFAVCGPDMLDDPTGDVIYAIDIGRSAASGRGSYIRPVGTNDVWAINVDFREELVAEEGPHVPPMLDPYIVPAAWPGLRQPGVDRIVVEKPDEPPLELQRVERVLTPEEAAAGEPPWHWTVKRGDRTYVADEFKIFSFGGFLTQATYTGILGPHDPLELGFDQPRGRITFRGAGDLHMQLVIGGQTPRGGVPILNSFSGNLYEVAPDIAELMLPEMDTLLFDHFENPWEPFLRRSQPQ